MTHTTESGRSMVEMIAVLAVIGVISIGGISGISFGTKMFRSTATQEMVENIASDVIDLYSWNRELPTEDGDMKTRICRSSIWDTGCVDSGKNAAFKNPYGGLVIIKEDEVDSFYMQITDLPEDICQNYTTATWINVSDPTCSGTTLTVSVP